MQSSLHRSTEIVWCQNTDSIVDSAIREDICASTQTRQFAIRWKIEMANHNHRSTWSHSGVTRPRSPKALHAVYSQNSPNLWWRNCWEIIRKTISRTQPLFRNQKLYAEWTNRLNCSGTCPSSTESHNVQCEDSQGNTEGPCATDWLEWTRSLWAVGVAVQGVHQDQRIPSWWNSVSGSDCWKRNGTSSEIDSDQASWVHWSA